MATAVETPVDAMPNEPEANKLFRMVMKFKGSDLHLKVGLAPAMRLAGVLRQMQMPPLTSADMERLMFPLLSPRQKQILEDTGGIDFAHIIFEPNGDETRFRVNLFRQRGRLSLVARRVNTSIPDFEGLGLPPVLGEIASHDQGIVILAGVTGSGKSTTIAAMLQYVNTRERCHVVTIEDPIEFTFKDDKCIINQREVGIDVIDWDTALKHAVRQDPDIILVGEMRDKETFNAAMHAAETGHLVFGTIHASSAPSTISRILDLFPKEMHSAMRQNLAFNLKAIVAQKLLPTTKDWAAATGQTRVPLVRGHADGPDRQEAHPQRGRHQARPGHPDGQGDRHGRLHREPAAARRRREDRAGDGLRGRARTRRPCGWCSRASSSPSRASSDRPIGRRPAEAIPAGFPAQASHCVRKALRSDDPESIDVFDAAGRPRRGPGGRVVGAGVAPVPRP